MSRRTAKPQKHGPKRPHAPLAPVATAPHASAGTAPTARVETDPGALRAAMQKRLTLNTPAQGAVAFPALPGKVDEFVELLLGIFASLRRPFADVDRARFRASLLERLQKGFDASPHASVQVNYQTDDKKHAVLHWRIESFIPPPEARFEARDDAEEPPLLGTVADARLIQLAKELGAPRDVTFLDVGAAGGRNTLSLARLGHPTDAIEPIAPLADALERLAESAPLPVRVVRGDFSDPSFELPRERYRLVRFTEVDHRLRGLSALRRLLHRLSDVLEPDGAGLLHLFLARESYVPDPVTRELAEAMACPVYTREELEDAAFGLGLRLASDESVLTYERAHLAGWPPAPWYAAWASGAHLFDLADATPPLELRWLVYRRS